LSVLILG